jgi:hypothetical protein
LPVLSTNFCKGGTDALYSNFVTDQKSIRVFFLDLGYIGWPGRYTTNENTCIRATRIGSSHYFSLL